MRLIVPFRPRAPVVTAERHLGRLRLRTLLVLVAVLGSLLGFAARLLRDHLLDYHIRQEGVARIEAAVDTQLGRDPSPALDEAAWHAAQRRRLDP